MYWSETMNGLLAIGLLLISIYFTVYQYYARKRDERKIIIAAQKRIGAIKTVDYVAYSLVELAPKISLPSSYLKSGYQIEHLHHGFGAWSPEVSDWLINCVPGDIKYRHEETRFALSPLTTDIIAPHVELRQALSGKRFSNDLKIRMRTDLVRNEDGYFPNTIELQRTDYLANLCTNDLSFREVIDASKRQTLYNGQDYFLKPVPGTGLELRPYFESNCSNQIGISTIAFTSDGYLVLVDQTVNNLQSSGLVAPSGSGSLDESDLTQLGGTGDLVEWLCIASQRELREELGIQADKSFDKLSNQILDRIQISALLMGFCVYLFRGGKPEFFFLASLSCSLSELSRNRKHTLGEEELSQPFVEIEDYRLDGRGSRADQVIRVLDKLREQERFRLSFPLEIQLLITKYICRNYRDKIENLLEVF